MDLRLKGVAFTLKSSFVPRKENLHPWFWVLQCHNGLHGPLNTVTAGRRDQRWFEPRQRSKVRLLLMITWWSVRPQLGVCLCRHGDSSACCLTLSCPCYEKNKHFCFCERTKTDWFFWEFFLIPVDAEK